MTLMSENPLVPTCTVPDDGVRTSHKRQKTAKEIIDPVLMTEPQIGAGRPACWESKPPNGGYRGAPVPEPGEDCRRALVLVNYLQADVETFRRKLLANVKDYARGAESLDARPFFTERGNSVTAAAVFKACENDELIYRCIIRPYDKGFMVDVDFVRELMQRVSKHLGCRVGWIAAIHIKPTVPDPKSRHVHMIVRGVTLRNERMRLSREFRRRGFSNIVAHMMTEKVGPMTEAEIERATRIYDGNASMREQLSGHTWKHKWRLLRERAGK